MKKGLRALSLRLELDFRGCRLLVLGKGALRFRRLNKCTVIVNLNPPHRTWEVVEDMASGRTGTNQTRPPRTGQSVRSGLHRTEFHVLLLLEGLKVAAYVTGTVHCPLQRN